MADKTTIARPYAQAMFDVACGKGDLAKTSDALTIASAIAQDAAFSSILDNPHTASDKLAELMIGVVGDKATKEVNNFIKVMAENRRLDVMPEVSELFKQYKATEESTVNAEVISATKLTAAQQKQIASKLKQRLGREVTLQCSIDENIIGGAIIRAGDLVIDGSITGQLEKLSQALSH